MNSPTKYELHDGSTPPTEDESILDGVLEDIAGNGDLTLEAIGSEGLLGTDAKLRLDVRMRLVAAIIYAGKEGQSFEDEKLGRRIRELVFGYVSGGLSDEH